MSEDTNLTIVDFITGQTVPDVGAEANRQAVERFLVEEKGYAREDIEVDARIAFTVGGETYNSRVDLVASVSGKRIMAVKCAPGSLGSREREIVAAARLIEPLQLPFAAVSDGKTAIVLDTVSGKKTGEGMDAIPSKEAASRFISENPGQPYPEKKIERERIIFRSYDSMNVNVRR